MTRIPAEARDMIEKAIYLPMTVSILNRDMKIIQQGPFKLKDPYLHLIEQALKLAQRDLYDVKNELRRRKIKVHEVSRTKPLRCIPLYMRVTKKSITTLIPASATRYPRFLSTIYSKPLQINSAFSAP